MSNINALTKPEIQNIPPYIPGRTSESVKEKYHLDKVLKLASNENQFGASPKAIAAMQAAVAEANIYPDPFCMGIRKKLGKKFGFDESGDNTIISVGLCGFFDLVAEVFIQKGDEYVTCGPTFSALNAAVKRNGGTVIECPITADTQEFDLDAMAAAVNDKTKMVYICNPNNPTGTVVDSKKLKEFIHKMPSHVITVIDEAYIEFAEDPTVESMIPEIADDLNLIVCRTFSKIHGLAGERIGYSFMNKELHGIMQKATSVFVVTRSSLAGAMASVDDEEFLSNTAREIAKGRAYVTKELEALGWKVWPSKTNFVYADSHLDTKLLATELEKKGLIIRGNFKYSRITIGRMDQNEEMIDIIKAVVNEGNVPKA